MNQKGQTSFFIVFIIGAIFFTLLFAIIIPSVINFNLKAYQSAEQLFDMAEETANKIQDANIKTAMLEMTDVSQSSIPTQTQILGEFFQWGWVITIFCIALVLFIITRKQVETQRYGGGYGGAGGIY